MNFNSDEILPDDQFDCLFHDLTLLYPPVPELELSKLAVSTSLLARLARFDVLTKLAAAESRVEAVCIVRRFASELDTAELLEPAICCCWRRASLSDSLMYECKSSVFEPNTPVPYLVDSLSAD